MKKFSIIITFVMVVTIHAPAATLYVNLNSTNPVPPYSTWSTAATNIQDAIDASTNSDVILVTNGIYATGGRTVNGYTLTNRVVVDKAVRVQSVNGPAVTVIEGNGPVGNNAVRCAYLTNDAVLAGFTLISGSTAGGSSVIEECTGGGSWSESWSAVISNCVLTGNVAGRGGGGAFGGTLISCIVTSNVAPFGGGAASNTLLNCTLFYNHAVYSGFTSYGGGAYDCALTNCLIAGNNGNDGAGAAYSALTSCVISNNFAMYGGGMFSGTANDCLLENNDAGAGGGAYNSYLINDTVVSNTASPNGPGVGAGVYGGSASNCVVYYNRGSAQANFPGNMPMQYCCTTPLPASGFGNITNEPLFVDRSAEDFHLQSNSPCINAGDNMAVTSRTDLDGNARIVNGTVDMGAYEYQGNVRYVSLSSTNPIAPYSDWSIAATNIQDAIDVSTNGDLILVTNGVYATGGRPVNGNLTNRVSLTKPLLVQSLNGPAVTVIQGYQVTGSTNGDSAVRCVYMTNGASLVGFTITNGATRALANGSPDCIGGGVWCASSNAFLTNCIIVGNTSGYGGGGVFEGTMANCMLRNNSVLGGRDWGGGTWNSMMIHCIVENNKAGMGGGAYQSQLDDCLVVSNTAVYGGGAEAGGLVNCTVVGNSASYAGGGIMGLSATDSIIYYNNAPSGPNWSPGYNDINCCTYPLPSGIDNITNEPAFLNPVGGDFHLQPNSPCINSGDNAYVTSTTDLDGNPRIVGGTVDIGAYEYPTPVSKISYAWLQQYGLPITTNIDTSDLDGTGFNVYQDWIAGLDPTNALSILAMLPPVPTNNPAGLVVSWQSVSNRTYFLQSSTNLAAQPAFSTIQSNIVGQPDRTSFMDTNAVGDGPFFYRVGVQ